MSDHQIELDGAGFASRPRLTCCTCKEALVNQPYMNRRVWLEKVTAFMDDHPSSVLAKYLKRISK
jgi:hypothetical protein